METWQKWNVINLVRAGVLKVFIVAIYHDKVHNLNSCIALPPLLVSPSL
jgi:hypothetical protein